MPTIPSLGGTITAQSSWLASVPIEVLLYIGLYLETPDYCAFRITCRQIEDRLLDAFAREFFTKRQFMFTEFSLQALVDISHSRFSNCLNHVDFGLEQPITTYPTLVTGRNITEWHNNCTLECLDHEAFLATNRDVDLLAEAFGCLGSLNTIGIRDFNSQSRARDFPNDEWKSASPLEVLNVTDTLCGLSFLKFLSDDAWHSGYGLSMLERRAEPDWPYYQQDYKNREKLFIKRVFTNILLGAGKSVLPSRRLDLEVTLWRGIFSMSHLHIPQFVLPTVRPVLGHLRKLFLDLDSGGPFLFQADHLGNLNHFSNHFLMRFLAETPDLEHLRLNFGKCTIKASYDFLSWLSEPAAPPFKNPVPLNDRPGSIALANLKQIDIGMVAVEPQVLIDLIRKYRSTIEIISLRRVSLRHVHEVAAEDRVDLWAELFRHLATLDLNLKGFNMTALEQEVIGKNGVRLRKVTFAGSKQPGTKKWAGTDPQSGLRDFNEMVITARLNEDTETESSDSDSIETTVDD